MQPLGEAAGQSGGFVGLGALNEPVNLTPILECPPTPAAASGVSLLFARRRFKKPSASARTPALRARPCWCPKPHFARVQLVGLLITFQVCKVLASTRAILETAYT